MKKVKFAVLIVLAFSTFAFSQTEEVKREEKEITVCEIEFTGSGRTANFQFSYMYRVETDESGSVKKVKLFSRENPKFIKDEKFIPCIESWKLKPSEKYIVHFYLGTSGSYRNFISISNKTETIKMYLED